MSPQTALAKAIETKAIPNISIHFPVQGGQLDADHGYSLYSAITRHLPTVHGASWLGIELISGVPWREGIEQPLVFWVPSIAVAGMAVYTGRLSLDELAEFNRPARA